MQSLTPLQLQVIQALLSGQSITAAADAAGIHRTTIHHWTRTIPEFRLTLESVRQARIDAVSDGLSELVAPCFDLLKKVITDDSAPLALRVRAVLAVLKHSVTPEKSLTKALSDQWTTLQSAFSEGYKSGRETAPAQTEIHQDSSLSSHSKTDESPAQTPRNAACPCGSGNKYKRCCGRNAPPVLGKAA